jgi:BASS family bile acid:Na+ symporter
MRIINFIKKYMAVIVLLVAIVSLIEPVSFSWVHTSYINWMLGIIMLCMGITLKPSDFKIVFSRPKNVIIGCIAQFTIMPLLAFLLTKIFNLPQEIAVGVILVGCCPGGTASNVITYLAKGDLALSVGMTAVSTLLAPLLTPVVCWLLAGTFVEVDIANMFLSIVQVVIVPIVIGFGIQVLFPNFTKRINEILPALSTIVIALIVGAVVSANAHQLKQVGLLVLLVVALHNVCGFALGFFIGKLLHLPFNKSVAISIEVGMQNSGLACSLAQQHFSVLQAATVPGAVFSVWHNIAGAVLARIYNRNIQNESSTSLS